MSGQNAFFILRFIFGISLFVPLCPDAVVWAQPSVSPEAALEEAENQLKLGKIRAAESNLLKAIQSKSSNIQRKAYDRLLPLYLQIGRIDLLFSYGNDYRKLLSQQNDWNRWREISLSLTQSAIGMAQFQLTEQLLREFADQTPKTEELKPVQQIMLAAIRARIAEQNFQHAQAIQLWQLVEDLGNKELEQETITIPNRDRIEVIFKLCESYKFQKKYKEGIRLLVQQRVVIQKLNDPKVQLRRYRVLAEFYRDGKTWDAAEQELLAGIDFARRMMLTTTIEYAETLHDLSDIYDNKRDITSGNRFRTEATNLYLEILESNKQRENGFDVSTSFWRLQQLYQRSQQINKALKLTEQSSIQEWVSPSEFRVKGEQGKLNILRGTYGIAREKILETIRQIEANQPIHLVELCKNLNCLAIVEQARGNLDEANRLSERVEKMYKYQSIPADILLTECYNLQGTIAALKGNQRLAVEKFRAGLTTCELVGAKADRIKSGILLNLALVHKSQGEIDLALKRCYEALESLQQDAEPDELGKAAFLCAIGSLETERGQYANASQLATQVLATCEKLKIETGPLITTSLHSLAMYQLSLRNTTEARATLEKVLRLQQQAKQTLWMPRSMFYLGLAAEIAGEPDQALKHYQDALDFSQQSKRPFPSLQFSLAWRKATLLNKLGKVKESRTVLSTALDKVEVARLKVFGDAQQRTSFFNQFIPGFEQMVEWSIQDLQPRDAMLYAARGRSRSLLDQLQLSGVDPRSELKGVNGNKLKQQELQLREAIASLRTQAQLIPAEEIDLPETKKILTDIELKQEAYSEVWREILNSSAIYQSLSTPEQSLQELIQNPKQAIGTNTALLMYHFTRDNGYLFVLTSEDAQIRIFPLTVPVGLVEELAAILPKKIENYEKVDNLRGFKVRVKVPQPNLNPKEPVTEVSSTALTQDAVRLLVDYSRFQIENPEGSTRGFVLRYKDQKKQKLDAKFSVTEAFFPQAVRDLITKLNLKQVLIVPDGALHKFPIEAFPTQIVSTSQFLLDELPPVTYVPALAAIPLLNSRPKINSEWNLLTVANPTYPQTEKNQIDVVQRQRGTRLAIGLRGQFLPLPFTAEESKKIQSCFPPEQVIQLHGDQATEKNVVPAMNSRRLIHIAAHGFADQNFGNLFGALAITPPIGAATADNDGYLSLFEIYQLQLQQCDLAVLSACETNVGPQRPLEAGVTLASAFLAAGARRVVASQWSVDDQSTSLLMQDFVQHVLDASKQNQSLPISTALHQAKRRLRQQAVYTDPFYWAPFTLIGTPER